MQNDPARTSTIEYTIYFYDCPAVNDESPQPPPYTSEEVEIGGTFTFPPFTSSSDYCDYFTYEVPTLPPLPSGITFDPDTLVFSVDASCNCAGDHEITVTATNLLGNSASVTFTLTVTEASTGTCTVESLSAD